MKNKVNLSITRWLCPSVFICFLTALLNVSTIAYATELQSASPSNTIQTVYSQLLSAQKLCYQRVKWTDKNGIQQETSKFEQAVYEGDLQVVQNILKQDCALDPDVALISAIESGQLELEIIDYLLSLNVAKDIQTYDGKTILMLATEYNQ